VFLQTLNQSSVFTFVLFLHKWEREGETGRKNRGNGKKGGKKEEEKEEKRATVNDHCWTWQFGKEVQNGLEFTTDGFAKRKMK
jgi:transposase